MNTINLYMLYSSFYFIMFILVITTLKPVIQWSVHTMCYGISSKIYIKYALHCFGRDLLLENMGIYHQFSNIRRTQSQNINVCHLVLLLSLPNPLKPGVKLRMKMQLEQRRQAMLQLHLSDQKCYCLLRCDLY